MKVNERRIDYLRIALTAIANGANGRLDNDNSLAQIAVNALHDDDVRAEFAPPAPEGEANG